MVKKLKLVILNDNEPNIKLKNDWGWSIIIYSENWSILFDADTKPEIIEYNSKKLNISLENLEFAFLSHYHRDHYGGFSYIGKIVPGLKIYTPRRAMKFLREQGLQPVEISQPSEIIEDVWSSGVMGFVEEHALGIRVDGLGIVVIVGCSHPGVDKLARRLMDEIGDKIYLVMGGFHSPSRNTLDNLAEFARYIAPAHCSGLFAKSYVKKKYPQKYKYVKTGSIFYI